MCIKLVKIMHKSVEKYVILHIQIFSDVIPEHKQCSPVKLNQLQCYHVKLPNLMSFKSQSQMSLIILFVCFGSKTGQVCLKVKLVTSLSLFVTLYNQHGALRAYST